MSSGDQSSGRQTTLVANEVSALEHAYNDNEVRIRALLQDLGGQRDTLVGQAEQIRDLERGRFLGLGPAICRRPVSVKIGAVTTSTRGGRLRARVPR